MSAFRSRRWIVAFAALALIVALASACQPLGSRSERASSDWSRGERLGRTSVNDPVAQIVRADGAQRVLTWVRKNDYDGAELLHLAQLDAVGKLVTERDLDIETNRPTQVALASAGAEFHVLWIDRAEDNRALYHVRVDDRGRLTSTPQILSAPGAAVDAYAIAPVADGALEVVWCAVEGEQVGLHALRLDPLGQVARPSQPLGIKGFDPALQVGADGLVHFVWVQEPSYGEHAVYYGTYSPTERTVRGGVKLGAFPVGVGLVGHPPALGLTTHDTYVFWSIERRGGGLTQPMADSFYVSFPLGRPELAGPARRVEVPAWNRPLYAAAQSIYHISQMAPNPHGDLASEFVYFPYAVRSQRDELAVAFSVQISGRTQAIIQVAVTYWQGGELTGYQIAGQTASTSLKPVLDDDAQGDLHLAWIDTGGFGSYDLFAASTSSAVRARLNRVTLSDIVRGVLGVLWGVVQAMGFLPIVLAWGFVPLVIIVVYVLIVPEARLARGASAIVLVVAGLIYIVFKYALRPGWLMDLPLPRGLPSQTTDLLLLLTPLFISVIASLVTWWFSRRKPMASIFPAFGVFVLVDALLTLVIYIPGVLGE